MHSSSIKKSKTNQGEGKKPFKFLRKKFIALTILLGFTLNTFSSFTYAITPQLTPNQLIPPTLGTIEQTYKGTNGQHVYCIQDLHCDESVQKNVEKIISILKQKHNNNLKVVGVEGASKEINTSLIASIPDNEIKKTIVDNFVKDGRLTGADMYSINNPKSVMLHGVEDLDLYMQNFDKLYKALTYNEQLQGIISKIEKMLRIAKKILYTSALHNIEAQQVKYSQNEISLYKYISFIINFVSLNSSDINKKYPTLALFLRAEIIRQTLDDKAVHQEAFIVLKKIKKYLGKTKFKQALDLSKSDSQEFYKFLRDILREHKVNLNGNCSTLTKYFKLLDLQDKIKKDLLIKERDSILYEARKTLVKGQRDRQKLVYVQYYFNILKKCLRNQATEEEVNLWETNKNIFYKVIEDLNSRVVKENTFLINKDFIFEAEKNIESFYNLAVKRNEILASNMLHLMDTKKSKIGVIFTGGFHTKGISNILRNKGVSFTVIMPTTDNTTSNAKETYLKHIKEQAKTLEIDDIEIRPNTLALYNGFEQGALDKDALRFVTSELIKKYSKKYKGKEYEQHKIKQEIIEFYNNLKQLFGSFDLNQAEEFDYHVTAAGLKDILLSLKFKGQWMDTMSFDKEKMAQVSRDQRVEEISDRLAHCVAYAIQKHGNTDEIEILNMHYDVLSSRGGIEQAKTVSFKDDGLLKGKQGANLDVSGTQCTMICLNINVKGKLLKSKLIKALQKANREDLAYIFGKLTMNDSMEELADARDSRYANINISTAKVIYDNSGAATTITLKILLDSQSINPVPSKPRQELKKAEEVEDLSGYPAIDTNKIEAERDLVNGKKMFKETIKVALSAAAGRMGITAIEEIMRDPDYEITKLVVNNKALENHTTKARKKLLKTWIGDTVKEKSYLPRINRDVKVLNEELEEGNKISEKELILRQYGFVDREGEDCLTRKSDWFCLYEETRGRPKLKYIIEFAQDNSRIVMTDTNGKQWMNARVINRKSHPKDLDWDLEFLQYPIDLIFETSGAFLKYTDIQGHLRSEILRKHGVKVILSSPPKEETEEAKKQWKDLLAVHGINHDTVINKVLDEGKDIMSNASCTTQTLIALKVLQDTFGVITGTLDTIHAITNSQTSLPKQTRNAKGGGLSLKPSLYTTGVSNTVNSLGFRDGSKNIPFAAESIRLGTPTGSLVALSVELKNPAKNAEAVNDMFEKAANGYMKGLIVVDDGTQIKSSKDIVGKHQLFIEKHLTTAKTIRDKNGVIRTFATVYVWYDNEAQYVRQMLNLGKEYHRQKLIKEKKENLERLMLEQKEPFSGVYREVNILSDVHGSGGKMFMLLLEALSLTSRPKIKAKIEQIKAYMRARETYVNDVKTKLKENNASEISILKEKIGKEKIKKGEEGEGEDEDEEESVDNLEKRLKELEAKQKEYDLIAKDPVKFLKTELSKQIVNEFQNLKIKDLLRQKWEDEEEIAEGLGKRDRDVEFNEFLKGISKNMVFMFLGDIPDRWTQSIWVVDKLEELYEMDLVKIVSGNHDIWMIINLLGLHLPYYKGYEFYDTELDIDLVEFLVPPDKLKEYLKRKILTKTKTEDGRIIYKATKDFTKHFLYLTKQFILDCGKEKKELNREFIAKYLLPYSDQALSDLYNLEKGSPDAKKEFFAAEKDKFNKKMKTFQSETELDIDGQIMKLTDIRKDIDGTLYEKCIAGYIADIYKDDTERLKQIAGLWDNLRGKFNGINVYTGFNFSWNMGLKWWIVYKTKFDKMMKEEMSKIGEGNDNVKQAWLKMSTYVNAMVLKMIDEYSKFEGDEMVLHRAWSHMHYMNYTSKEAWGDDWSRHKGWGDVMLKELGLNGATYLRRGSPIRERIEFMKKTFSLYQIEQGQLGTHAWLPTMKDSSGDLVIGFKFEGHIYKGKEVFKGLDLLGGIVRNFNLDEFNSITDPQERERRLPEFIIFMRALDIVNSWYADKTTFFKEKDYIELHILKLKEIIRKNGESIARRSLRSYKKAIKIFERMFIELITTGKVQQSPDDEEKKLIALAHDRVFQEFTYELGVECWNMGHTGFFKKLVHLGFPLYGKYSRHIDNDMSFGYAGTGGMAREKVNTSRDLFRLHFTEDERAFLYTKKIVEKQYSKYGDYVTLGDKVENAAELKEGNEDEYFKLRDEAIKSILFVITPETINGFVPTRKGVVKFRNFNNFKKITEEQIQAFKERIKRFFDRKNTSALLGFNGLLDFEPSVNPVVAEKAAKLDKNPYNTKNIARDHVFNYKQRIRKCEERYEFQGAPTVQDVLRQYGSSANLNGDNYGYKLEEEEGEDEEIEIDQLEVNIQGPEAYAKARQVFNFVYYPLNQAQKLGDRLHSVLMGENDTLEIIKTNAQAESLEIIKLERKDELVELEDVRRVHIGFIRGTKKLGATEEAVQMLKLIKENLGLVVNIHTGWDFNRDIASEIGKHEYFEGIKKDSHEDALGKGSEKFKQFIKVLGDWEILTLMDEITDQEQLAAYITAKRNIEREMGIKLMDFEPVQKFVNEKHSLGKDVLQSFRPIGFEQEVKIRTLEEFEKLLIDKKVMDKETGKWSASKDIVPIYMDFAEGAEIQKIARRLIEIKNGDLSKIRIVVVFGENALNMLKDGTNEYVDLLFNEGIARATFYLPGIGLTTNTGYIHRDYAKKLGDSGAYIDALLYRALMQLVRISKEKRKNFSKYMRLLDEGEKIKGFMEDGLNRDEWLYKDMTSHDVIGLLGHLAYIYGDKGIIKTTDIKDKHEGLKQVVCKGIFEGKFKKNKLEEEEEEEKREVAHLLEEPGLEQLLLPTNTENYIRVIVTKDGGVVKNEFDIRGDIMDVIVLEAPKLNDEWEIEFAEALPAGWFHIAAEHAERAVALFKNVAKTFEEPKDAYKDLQYKQAILTSV